MNNINTDFLNYKGVKKNNYYFKNSSDKYNSGKHLFFTVSIKELILPFLFVLFTISLVIFSNSNLVASRNGLKLWAKNVVPSLFPFFIATNLLSHTNVINYISKYCDKFMRPLFNVPGESAYAFILGFISGYPVGAKIVTDLRNANLCTKDEGERMLCFTNNSGPLFILGTVRYNSVFKFFYWIIIAHYSYFICTYCWNYFRYNFPNKERFQ